MRRERPIPFLGRWLLPTARRAACRSALRRPVLALVLCTLAATGCADEPDSAPRAPVGGARSQPTSIGSVRGVSAGPPDAATDDEDDAAAGDEDGGHGTTGDSCTRADLTSAVEGYFEAMTDGALADLPLDPSARFTENAAERRFDQSFFQAGAQPLYRRSVLDAEQCESITEAAVEAGGVNYVFGLRLKLSERQIREIESIIVGPDGWFPDPQGILDAPPDDWLAPLPAAQQIPRAQLRAFVDDYFAGLGGGTLGATGYPFSADCQHVDNGFPMGDCETYALSGGVVVPRHYVVDVTTGIAVSISLFSSPQSGSRIAFHMFRVRDGELDGVRAIVGPSAVDPGWP